MTGIYLYAALQEQDPMPPPPPRAVGPLPLVIGVTGAEFAGGGVRGTLSVRDGVIGGLRIADCRLPICPDESAIGNPQSAIVSGTVGAAGRARPRTMSRHVGCRSAGPFDRARARKLSRHWSKPGGAAANAARGCASRKPKPAPHRNSARRVGRGRESCCFMALF